LLHRMERLDLKFLQLLNRDFIEAKKYPVDYFIGLFKF
jgi:hypothetical protein